MLLFNCMSQVVFSAKAFTGHYLYSWFSGEGEKGEEVKFYDQLHVGPTLSFFGLFLARLAMRAREQSVWTITHHRAWTSLD